jgi:glycosyltransferase involved in cell wall biosynthesis
MRIAYLAPYKGPTVLEQRPIVRGLSLSNAVKIELVAKAMRRAGHEVEIVSLGEVVDTRFRVYRGCPENRPFDPAIPVYYSSLLPVRFINGFWSSAAMVGYFKSRHRAKPFDIVVIFNLKRPHIACANYALDRGIPVVFEYEDDSFVNVAGRRTGSLIAAFHERSMKHLIRRVSAGIGVSPHLLSQLPSDIPKLLLRGAVGDDIATASRERRSGKQNWILFSGTHVPSNGVDRLIEAWGTGIPGWQLHITGQGQLTDRLKEMAAGRPGIVFHGLVSREKLVDLLCSARICINPHVVSDTPGNVFAFKIVEYVAAGAHCITTPMGDLEGDIEGGITYMRDNMPATIAATLKQVIDDRCYERTAPDAALLAYGTQAITRSLSDLLQTTLTQRHARPGVLAPTTP